MVSYNEAEVEKSVLLFFLQIYYSFCALLYHVLFLWIHAPPRKKVAQCWTSFSLSLLLIIVKNVLKYFRLIHYKQAHSCLIRLWRKKIYVSKESYCDNVEIFKIKRLNVNYCKALLKASFYKPLRLYKCVHLTIIHGQ